MASTKPMNTRLLVYQKDEKFRVMRLLLSTREANVATGERTPHTVASLVEMGRLLLSGVGASYGRDLVPAETAQRFADRSIKLGYRLVVDINE